MALSIAESTRADEETAGDSQPRLDGTAARDLRAVLLARPLNHRRGRYHSVRFSLFLYGTLSDPVNDRIIVSVASIDNMDGVASVGGLIGPSLARSSLC